MINKFEIDFSENFANQLLINPRGLPRDYQMLAELKKYFDKNVAASGYFLISSSGSSQKIGDSLKLVALARESIFNSAARFNQFFKVSANDRWGLVLPTFHVAGLAILARSYLAGIEVFSCNWDPETISNFLNSNRVTLLSIVPTQAHDILIKEIVAPNSLRLVFVGAGTISSSVLEGLISLGWPIIETYGMTETGSMVAIKNKKSGRYVPLPGVFVTIEENKLKVKCNSLLSARLQMVSGAINCSLFNKDDSFLTDDYSQVEGGEISILGRGSDFLKISGEGVSLSELTQNLQKVVFELSLNPNSFFLTSISDERRGSKLVLAVEDSFTSDQIEMTISRYNNSVRPYERISKYFVFNRFPRTELGKLKFDQLNNSLIDGNFKLAKKVQ